MSITICNLCIGLYGISICLGNHNFNKTCKTEVKVEQDRKDEEESYSQQITCLALITRLSSGGIMAEGTIKKGPRGGEGSSCLGFIREHFPCMRGSVAGSKEVFKGDAASWAKIQTHHSVHDSISG